MNLIPEVEPIEAAKKCTKVKATLDEMFTCIEEIRLELKEFRKVYNDAKDVSVNDR